MPKPVKKCKLCGDETKTSFNIRFKSVSICELCATSIFVQQAHWYAELSKSGKLEDLK